MARKTIRIDQYIGGWGYNKEMLRFDLKDTETDGAVIEIASLGGSLFDAIHMHNQIAQHGNVEVIFVGPSASAATVLAMSAKKVSIVDNAFLLIHKVMSMVDNWGTFNEDDLDKLIQDLQQLRTENQKFDLAIARIYSKRSGKSIEETIDTMKTGTWLDSKEAKTAGLVDEIVNPDTKWNYYTERFVAMVRGNQLPDLPNAKSQIPALSEAEGTNQESQITNMMTQFPKINQLLEIDELQATEEGCYLNEEQLQTFETRISSIEDNETKKNELLLAAEIRAENAEKELTAVRSDIEDKTATIESMALQTSIHEKEIEALKAEVEKHKFSISAADANIQRLENIVNGIDESVANAESYAEKESAITALLSHIPGTTPPGTLSKGDKGKNANGVDWDLINSLPHNQEADQNL